MASQVTNVVVSLIIRFAWWKSIRITRKAADRIIMRHSIRRTIRSLLPILLLVFSLGPTLWSAAPLRGEAPADDQRRLWIDQAARPAYQGAPFTFDRNDFNEDTRGLPIGVFDSGIGGLTVMEAILSSDAFDNETLEPTPMAAGILRVKASSIWGIRPTCPMGTMPPQEKRITFAN